MTALAPAAPSGDLLGFLDRLRRAEPTFYALAVVNFVAIAPTLFAAAVDSREFLGVDNWVKPLKFEIALGIYTLSLAFFARFLPAGTASSRTYRIYVAAIAFAVVIEQVWIGGAAMLGTNSHFNPSPFGQIVYSVMGAAAVLLTSASTVYAVAIARNRDTGLSSVVKEGVVVGLALVLPLTLLTAGTMSGLGSHFVGGSGSDAGGLPLMGWSRDGGDLRVAHFFATHALHFVPAFALASAWLFGRKRRLPLRLFIVAFTAFVLFTFVQALMGRPFIGFPA
jgi:hypothetical protein